MTARSRPIGRFPARPILITAGVFGWIAFAWLLSQMHRGNPPGAGFDLELLVAGGRKVAAGLTPYDPTMLGGGSVEITALFYSYPPLVAQAFSLLAGLPSVVILDAAIVLASITAVVVGWAVAGTVGSARTARAVVLPLAALLPFWFPYTVGMLFGNIDIFFPALYGLILIAILRPAGPGAGRWEVAAGVALALAAVTKLHPAVLGIWLVIHGAVEWRRREDLRAFGAIRLPRSWRIAAVAAIAVAAIVAASLAAGGLEPWRQYVAVLRAGASVDLLDPRNLGPAVQLVMLFGLGPAAVGPVQVAVLIVGLLTAIVAALRVRDPLESLAWAAIASFIVLPVTWFHHFAALVPFGIAAIVRGSVLGPEVVRRLWILAVVGFAVVMIGFGQPPTWLLVPVFLLGARWTRPLAGPGGLQRPAAPSSDPAPGPAAQPSS